MQPMGGLELVAPPHWQCIDCLSDIHLHAADHRTFEAWRHYMLHTPADAIWILGDLFEVWVGDDTLTQPDADFERACLQVLADTGRRKDLLLMHGNRDFLVGPSLLQQCHARALPDPCTLHWGRERWVFSHGDALCTGDVPYQEFRRQVRASPWQTDFLALPYPERQRIARGIRNQSEALKRTDHVYADVDTQAACDLLTPQHASHLVHGHTHRPGTHAMVPGMQRLVLSDWDFQAQPARGDVLRIRLQADQSLAVERLSALAAVASAAGQTTSSRQD